MEKEVLEKIESAANDHGEPHWFVDRRLDASQAITVDLPDEFSLDAPNFKRSDKNLAEIAESTGIKVVQLGQRIIKNELPDELDDKGVILTDIFTAFREHPRLIQRYFMDKVIDPNESNLTKYHLAMINSGIFLYISKNVQINTPIDLQMIQDSTVKNPSISHVLIVAEEGSKVTLKQTSTTVGAKENLAQPFVEIVARSGSEVNYESLDKYSSNTRVFFERQGFLNSDAKINWKISLQNGGNTTGKIFNNLFGSNSTVNVEMDSQNTETRLDLGVNKHGKDVNYSETFV
ncbi:SufD family Fe-S cluster assembly protein [Companilactobacillus keshanensis]|uniref:SufD family Fe-S cluster assembly protein n=1 Tax=Companilactobacillus keshanensis TaxID=2486003 RepID=A0ABW4BTL3_9LACO|nr:SufD family Fe-S cluster assembly protein [Companilactobacillus keshanensis]